MPIVKDGLSTCIYPLDIKLNSETPPPRLDKTSFVNGHVTNYDSSYNYLKKKSVAISYFLILIFFSHPLISLRL